MANRVYQFRRGTTAQNDAFRGKEGELSIDLDSMRLRIHNDVEMGGYEVPNMTDLDNYYTKTETDASISAATSTASYSKSVISSATTEILDTNSVVVGLTLKKESISTVGATAKQSLIYDGSNVVWADATIDATGVALGNVLTADGANGYSWESPVFYTKTEVDTKITDVLGTATSAMDTLGEIETLFNTLKSGATNELDTLGEIATKINSLSSDVDSLQTTLSNEQTKISVLQTQMGGTSVSNQIDAALAMIDLGTI